MRHLFFALGAALTLTACTTAEDLSPGASSADPPDPPAPTPATVCQQLDSTERVFSLEGTFGGKRRDRAAEAVIPTTTGPWSLAQNYSGCETYLFVPDTLIVSPLDSTPLLERASDITRLVEKSPPNAHYFFITLNLDGSTPPADFAMAMEARIEEALAGYDEASRAYWRERLHIVTEVGGALEPWVVEALRDNGSGFGIDRFQQIRKFGNLADVQRFDQLLNNAGQWPWRANLAYVAHEAQYYNYESDREDMLDALGATTVWLMYEENVHASGKQHVTVELPDAGTMSTYDTMLVDLSHVCDPTQREQGNCDAWDAIQSLRLCDADEPERCEVELARYITTYHREGRWLADASQLLPHLKAGGSHRFKLEGPRSGHFVSMRLLLADTGKATKPFHIQALWEGGSWTPTYDDDRPPLTIDVPADAKKVYLHAVLSGHGQGGEYNCAEFCGHSHTFTIGDATYVADHPDIENREGCLEQIDRGTVPNQFGTWWFSRTSWCPGKQVDPWVWDITDQVTPGQSVEVSYVTNYGTPLVGGSIFLRTWVTSWR